MFSTRYEGLVDVSTPQGLLQVDAFLTAWNEGELQYWGGWLLTDSDLAHSQILTNTPNVFLTLEGRRAHFTAEFCSSRLWSIRIAGSGMAPFGPDHSPLV